MKHLKWKAKCHLLPISFIILGSLSGCHGSRRGELDLDRQGPPSKNDQSRLPNLIGSEETRNIQIAAEKAEVNGVMMQYFHWYTSKEGTHWQEFADNAAELAEKGITAVWLPPAYKGLNGANDVGYGVYDLYDLGEFNAQGSIRTKYGTKDEYLEAIAEAKNAGLQIYADVVLNHMMGADETEIVKARKVATDNRYRAVSGTYDIEAYTHFNFPARNDKYSDFKWHWYHFDGVDWDARSKERGAVYQFVSEGKAWDENVSTENANYDYLMGADLDFSHPEVRLELKNGVLGIKNLQI